MPSVLRWRAVRRGLVVAAAQAARARTAVSTRPVREERRPSNLSSLSLPSRHIIPAHVDPPYDRDKTLPQPKIPQMSDDMLEELTDGDEPEEKE